MKDSCERCLMPFKKDRGKRESDLYCSYCFKDGEFFYKGTDIKEFKKLCHEAMIQRGINKYLAKIYTFMISFAPYWKKNKNYTDPV